MPALRICAVLLALLGPSQASADEVELLQRVADDEYLAVPDDEDDEELGYEKVIWAFWEYEERGQPKPGKEGAWVGLNVETWRKHAPDFEIRLVNDSNLHEFVPDLPKEYYRFPYTSAKSDFIRAALLYHHGGIYMDTDFMVMSDLKPVLDLLKTNEVVAYRTGPELPDHACGQDFSSNFMAGRRHNKFSETWWNNIKLKVTRECALGEWAFEKVCCNVRGVAREEQTKECHVPWAHLEHIKLPSHDHDRKPSVRDPTKNFEGSEEFEGVKVLSSSGKDKPFQHPEGMKFACFGGDKSMAPHINGEIFWQRWDRETNSTLEDMDDAVYDPKKYDRRFSCTLDTVSGDMNCESGNWAKGQHRTFKNFVGRIAYHMFFHTRMNYVRDREEALNSDWFIAQMYRKSLGLPAQ